MKYQDLYTYPIKSLGGIRTTEAKVFERGFEFDRRWMLVDNSCRFITQRVEHGLALLQTEITGNSILVKHKVIPDLQISIPIGFHSDELISVSIWDDTVKAFTLSNYYDDWFSEVLKKPCRLVHVPESTTRLVDSRFAKNGENVSLADAFPFLLINQTSLNDLNNRLSEAVPMNRFRPNIVLAGTEPFAEDSWLEIQIGKVRFQVAKP